MEIRQFELRRASDKKLYLDNGKTLSVSLNENESICNPGNIIRTFKKLYSVNDLAEEYIWILAFDTCMHLIGTFEIAHGSSDCCVSSIRSMMQRLFLIGANKYVVVHNHPSGSLNPSEDDIKFTHKLALASSLCEVNLLDHIIVIPYDDAYYSMLENKTLHNLDSETIQDLYYKSIKDAEV